MSEPKWTRLERERLSRRALLRWSARLGVGATAAQPEPAAEPEAAPEPPVVVEQIVLARAAGSAPLSAGGALGRYGDSEAALYRDGNFGNSDGIVGYVGWRGGKGRKGVAQAAGIWDESLCEPGRGRAPAASDPMSGR